MIPDHWKAEQFRTYGIVLTCSEGSVTISEFMRNFASGCCPVRERGTFIGSKWKEQLCASAIARLKEHEDYWTEKRSAASKPPAIHDMIKSTKP